MAKRKVSRVVRSTPKSSMSPVMQFAVVFIIVAAIALAYYVGAMK